MANFLANSEENLHSITFKSMEILSAAPLFHVHSMILLVVFLNEALPITYEDFLSAQLSSLLSLSLLKHGVTEGPVLVLITVFYSLAYGFRYHFYIADLQVFILSPICNFYNTVLRLTNFENYFF